MDDLFLIAEIKAVHGIHGFIVVDSFSDFSERFYELNSVFLDFFGSMKEFFVENVKTFDGRFALKFKGFNSVDEVKFLIGKKIYVDKAHLVKLADDTFFIHDLIGSAVFRDSVLLGHIEDVMTLPSNDVYLVKDLNGKQILIPAVKDFVKSFDAEKKILELVAGCDLLYDDED